MSALPQRKPGTHLPDEAYLSPEQQWEWPRNDPDLPEGMMHRVQEGIRALPGRPPPASPTSPTETFRGWMQPPTDQSPFGNFHA